MKDIITKLILIFLLLSLCGCVSSSNNEYVNEKTLSDLTAINNSTAKELLDFAKSSLDKGEGDLAFTVFYYAGIKGAADGYYAAALLKEKYNSYLTKILYFLSAKDGHIEGTAKWENIKSTLSVEEIAKIENDAIKAVTIDKNDLAKARRIQEKKAQQHY